MYLLGLEILRVYRYPSLYMKWILRRKELDS
jgi:hypothetical protein